MNKNRSLRSTVIPLVGQFIEKNLDLVTKELSKDASPPIRDLRAVTRRAWLAYVIGCQEILPLTCTPLLATALRILDEEEKEQTVNYAIRVARFDTLADLAIYYVESIRVWNAASEMALLEIMAEHESDVAAAAATGDASQILHSAYRLGHIASLVKSAGQARRGASSNSSLADVVKMVLGDALKTFPQGGEKDDCDCKICQLRRRVEAGETVTSEEFANAMKEGNVPTGSVRASAGGKTDLPN